MQRVGRRITVSVGMLCGVLAPATASASVSAEPVVSPRGFRDAPAESLTGTPLEPLASYIGDWEVETTWEGGMSLWARNEYRVMLGGAFVDVLTWAKDGDGEPYLRYYSVYRWDTERDEIVARGFQSDGTSESLAMVPADDGDGFVTEWGDFPMRIRQSVATPVDGKYRWRVWMLTGPDAEPVAMMDGDWVRQDSEQETEMEAHSNAGPPPGPYAIDPGLFVGTGEVCRSIVCSQTIDASAKKLFGLLTTEAGMRAVYGIESRIDLRVGGPYEWYFLDDNPYGTKGGEGNQILAWVPDKTLVFSWNAPPEQAESRAKRTWVVLSLDEQDAGGTAITITHAGFGAGAHWDETKAYFEAAWPRVIAALKAAAEK